MSFLEHLRTKPEHVKARYSFFGALTVTFVIGTIWLVSLPAKFSATDGEFSKETVSEAGSDGAAANNFSELFSPRNNQTGAAIDATNADRRSEEVVKEDLSTTTAPTTDEEKASTTKQEMPGERATNTLQHTEPRTVLIATTSSKKNEQKSE